MPAAAVIPAPIAYIKVVAVEKLVVGLVLARWVFVLDRLEFFFGLPSRALGRAASFRRDKRKRGSSSLPLNPPDQSL